MSTSTAVAVSGRLRARAILFGPPLVLLVAFVVHGPALDNGFLEADDWLHLLGARDGNYPSAHFRPAHDAWMRLLYRLSGTAPFPYYVSGLLLHAINALLVCALVHAVVRRILPAMVAGVVFASLYASNEVVFWVSAQTSSLAVLFVLLSGVCFAKTLRSSGGERTPWYLGSLAAALFAMLAKEDCVVLGVLLPALDLTILGSGGFLSRARLGKYAPFVFLAVGYLALAFRPALWSGRDGLSLAYGLSWEIVPKLVRSFGWRFVPRRAPPGIPTFALPIGIAILAGVLLGARVLPKARRLLLLGLATAVFALLPTAPGPFRMITGRHGYAGDIGVAMILAGFIEAFSDGIASRSRDKAWRFVPAAVLGGFVVVQALAVRSVDEWHYERSTHRLESVLEATERCIVRPLAASDGPERIVFVSPPTAWAENGYGPALRFRFPSSFARLEVDSTPYDDAFLARVGPGGDLNPGSTFLVAETPRGIERLRPDDLLPTESWERWAQSRESRGQGRTLPVFVFTANPR